MKENPDSHKLFCYSTKQKSDSDNLYASLQMPCRWSHSLQEQPTVCYHIHNIQVRMQGGCTPPPKKTRKNSEKINKIKKIDQNYHHAIYKWVKTDEFSRE